MGHPVHTYSVVDRPAHVTTGYSCWCQPRVEQICPECEDTREHKAGCWKCAGKGWIECPNPDIYDGTVGLLIVHNEAMP